MEKQTQQSHETNPVVRSFQGERGVARSGVGGTIIGLQQSAGNRAVLGLLNRRLRRSDSSSPEGNNHHSAASESSQVAKKVLHAKLRVSQPTDPSEIEADRVAEQVMSMPEPSASNGHGMQTSTAPATPAARTAPIAGTAPVARSAPVAASAPAGSAPVATKPIQQAQPNVIQREADNDKRDNARLGVVPPFGGGAPLDESSRNFFEPRFARDLSNVRLHTGVGSARLAHAFNARAFAVGSDIVFGEGEYSPGTASGRKLLAHELAHVVMSPGSAGAALMHRSIERESFGTGSVASSELSALRSAVELAAGARTIFRDPDDDDDDDDDDTEPDVGDPLYAMLRSAQEAYDELSHNQGFPADERAKYRRIYILLSEGPKTAFKDENDVDKFIDWCKKTGEREDATLNNSSADQGKLLLDEGAAFPNTWADKLSWELHIPPGFADLKAAIESRRQDATNEAKAVSDEIWDRGLPLSRLEALQVSDSTIARWGLDAQKAKDNTTKPINRFVRALIRWEISIQHLILVNAYESQFNGRIDNVRKGVVVVDQNEYALYKGAYTKFQFVLKGFKDAESNPNDVGKALTALLIYEPTKFDRNKFYGWPDDGVRLFFSEIAEADKKIAETGKIASIYRAFVWAHEGGFFLDATEEVWNGIKDNWVQMIATLVGIIVAQEIPGVNIGLDLVLWIEFGSDAIDAAIQLATALKDSGGAKTVVQMEHGAAELASVLVGVGAEIAMWAATWGTAKMIGQAMKWKKAEEFLNRHGKSEEAKEALKKSKGNADEAENIIKRKREQERQEKAKQEAEQRKKAEEAERQRKQEEEAKRKQEQEAKEAEAKRKREEEAKRKQQEEEKRKQEEAKRKQEEADKRREEQEAKRRQEEEAKHKREEETKRKQEEEAKRKQEAEAKRKQEEEAKRKREEDAKKKREDEAKRKREEEAKQKEQIEKAKTAEAQLKASSAKRVETLEQELASTVRRIDDIKKEIQTKKARLNEIQREASAAKTKSTTTKRGQELMKELTTPQDAPLIAKARREGWTEAKIQEWVLTEKGSEVAAGIRKLEQDAAVPTARKVAIEAEIRNLKGIISIPEVAGGSHSRVRSKAVGGEVNHIPMHAGYKKLIKLTYDEGPALWMTKDDHALMESTGWTKESIKRMNQQSDLIAQGKFYDAMELDIAEIRKRFPDGRYEKGIQQMLRYAKDIDPSKLMPIVK